MSIVDNLQQFRIFIFIFLGLSMVCHADWQTELSLKLCQQWHDLAAAPSECELSFPGLSSQYTLAACPDGWQYKLVRPLKAGRNGIELSCDAPRWQQNFAVHLHVYRDVAVLARPVSIGQTLRHDDVSFIRHDIGAISKDFYTAPEQVLGLQIRRNLRAGTLLNNDMLETPLLIERGDLVIIQSQRPGVSVRIQGTALERGRLGQVIRVRNNQSQNIVAARVLEAGIVQVE